MILLLTFSIVVPASPANAVVGGAPAESGDWGHTVALLDPGVAGPARAQFCGGVRVHPRWVLTAAHCVEVGRRAARPAEIQVAASARLAAVRPGARAAVERVVRYPLRRPAGRAGDGHDLALLRLARPLPGPVARVARGGHEGAVAIAGWGARDTAGRRSPVLRAGVASLLASEDCRALGAPEDTLCATAPGSAEASACAGDSGGPLAARPGGAVIGIVSMGSARCARGHAAAFTDLALYEPWVRRVIRGGDPRVSVPRVSASRLAGGEALRVAARWCQSGARGHRLAVELRARAADGRLLARVVRPATATGGCMARTLALPGLGPDEAPHVIEARVVDRTSGMAGMSSTLGPRG